MEINKAQQITVDITPEDLAELFCSMMDGRDVAKFYNAIAETITADAISAMMRRCKNSDQLTDGAKKIIAALSGKE